MSWVPVIRRLSWLAAIPHVAVLVLVLYAIATSPNTSIVVMVAYLAYVYGMRNFMARAHRRAMRLVCKQQFEPAINGGGIP
jgi:hypothetical protein